MRKILKIFQDTVGKILNVLVKFRDAGMVKVKKNIM
jgi:hypothetical protein